MQIARVLIDRKKRLVKVYFRQGWDTQEAGELLKVYEGKGYTVDFIRV
jgi:hypothetical protein